MILADLKNFEKSIAFENYKTLQQIILSVENHKIPPGILNVDIVTRPGRIDQYHYHHHH